MNDLPPLQKRIARVLKRRIRELGKTIKDVSLESGKSDDALGKVLRGTHGLSVDYLEAVCEALSISARDVVIAAYPQIEVTHSRDPSGISQIIASLEALLVADELDNKRLQQYLKFDPLLVAGATPRSLSMDPLKKIEDQVFVSVESASSLAVFSLEEMQEDPSLNPLQYIATLGLLGALLRSLRRPTLNDAVLLLLRAFELARVEYSPELHAYLADKCSRVLWSFGHHRIALEILSEDLLVSHPSPETLFALKGNYYFFQEDFAKAKQYLNLAKSISSATVIRASVADLSAQISAKQGNREAALDALGEIDPFDKLPAGLRDRLEWTEGRVYRDTGAVEQAQEIFLQLYRESSLSTNPQLDGYLLHDILEILTEIPHHLMPRIRATLENLDPANPIERGLLRELNSMLSKRPHADMHADRRGIVSRTI